MTLYDFRLPSSVRRTLRAIAPILLPREVEDQGLVDATVDGIELFMRSMPTEVRLALVAGLVTFELSAALVPSNGGRRFSKLPLDLRERHYERYWSSPLFVFHQFARGIKAAAALAYYDLPQVRRRLQYHPEAWIAKVAKERMDRFAGEIQRHEEMLRAPAPLVPADRLTKKGAKRKSGKEVRHVEAA